MSVLNNNDNEFFLPANFCSVYSGFNLDSSSESHRQLEKANQFKWHFLIVGAVNKVN